MKGQVTVDTLINAAVISAIVVMLLTAFYGVYRTTEAGIRRMHLKYLSSVIEDRMKICGYVDNIRIYAPYEVNVFCKEGKVCWRNICEDVSCVGGGSGKIFIVKGCKLVPE